MTDRERIIDTMIRVGVGIDARDWAAVEECFADQVWFDGGGQPGGGRASSPSSITAELRKDLEPIERSHHQFGNYRVEKSRDEADLSCYGIVMHYCPVPHGRSVRTVAGSYEVHLVREGDDWHIDRFRFERRFADGDLEQV